MKIWKNIKGAIKKEYQSEQDTLLMFWKDDTNNPKNDARTEADYIINARKVLAMPLKYEQRKGYFILSRES